MVRSILIVVSSSAACVVTCVSRKGTVGASVTLGGHMNAPVGGNYTTKVTGYVAAFCFDSRHLTRKQSNR